MAGSLLKNANVVEEEGNAHMTPGRRIAAALPVAVTGEVPACTVADGPRLTDVPRGWSTLAGRAEEHRLPGTCLRIGARRGRRLLQWWRALPVVARLGEPDLSGRSDRAAANHGRSGPADGSVPDPHDGGQRTAPFGRRPALATLWAQDNLIVEEEKALILRGFAAKAWQARRRCKATPGTDSDRRLLQDPFLEETGTESRYRNYLSGHIESWAPSRLRRVIHTLEGRGWTRDLRPWSPAISMRTGRTGSSSRRAEIRTRRTHRHLGARPAPDSVPH